MMPPVKYDCPQSMYYVHKYSVMYVQYSTYPGHLH